MNYTHNGWPIKHETFLQRLHHALQKEKRAVLFGRNGTGKTTIAREYTQYFAQEYGSIVWINATTDETFLADLYAAAQHFSLPIDITQGVASLFQALHIYLNKQQNALLILDHLSSGFAIQPSSDQEPPSYQLLFITHVSQTPIEIPRIELTGLDIEEGVSFVLLQAGLLKKTTTLNTIEDELRMNALELVREMRESPIALHLATGYIYTTKSNLRDYLDTFREAPANLYLSMEAHGNNLQEPAVACEINLHYLVQNYPTTLTILQICSLLLPDTIPDRLFLQETKTEAETANQQEKINILVDLGLLNAEHASSNLSMHPLLQQLVYQFFSLERQPQQQRLVEQALSLFQQFLPSLATEPLSFQLNIVGHIQHMAKLSDPWMLTSIDGAEVFGWAATFLWQQQMHVKAEVLLKRALTIWEKILGTSHPTVATTLIRLATLNALLKNYEEAEALARRAITSKIAALGVNHPDVLMALDHLGQYYAAQNKLNEARACYEKVIAMGEMLKLRLHPVYGAACYHLALLYIDQRKFEQAEDLLNKVWVLWNHVLGLQHSSSIEVCLSLAEVAAHLKHWERVQQCYEQALPSCEQRLNQKDPVILGHLQVAASAFFHLKKLEKAEEIWLRILEVQKHFPDKQVETEIRCLDGLTRIALARGNTTKAYNLLEEAQKIYSDQSKNLELAEIFDTLAEVEKTEQHYDQAINAAKKALEIRERVSGAESLDLIENLNSLAELYITEGSFRQAESLLQQAIYLYQYNQKPEDLRLDPVLSNLAELEIKRQRIERARMYLQRVRAIRVQALGETDHRTQEIINKLETLSIKHYSHQ